MVKTLILVRHGQAEPSSAAVPDIERSLTDAGRAALAGPQGFPRTFALLSSDERRKASLWASEALRARQTAQEVAAVLGERTITSYSYLFDQDEQRFIEHVRQTDADCLIVVGHIPFVDRVTEYLTGSHLSFRPGAAAALRLDHSLDPCQSEVIWFVQGPVA